jgi:hypothetical protein
VTPRLIWSLKFDPRHNPKVIPYPVDWDGVPLDVVVKDGEVVIYEGQYDCTQRRQPVTLPVPDDRQRLLTVEYWMKEGTDEPSCRDHTR